MKCFSFSKSAEYRRSVLLAPAVLFLGLTGFAQILTFDFAGAAGDEVTYPSNFNDARLTSSSISRSHLGPTPNADRFNSRYWPYSSSPDPVKYLTFTITPLPGKSFSITQVKIKYERTNTGPHKLVIRTSADGFTNNMGGVASLTDNTSPQTRLFIFSITGQETPLVIRLYGYETEYATAGELGLGDNPGNDLVVNGTTEDLSTTVQFLHTSSTVAEDAGPVDLPILIHNPDPTIPTSVILSVTDPYGRIASFTSPVVFPAGSSDNEVTHVVLNSDTIFHCDEDAVFTITGVTGGPNASVGQNSSETVTVIDNDAIGAPVATAANPINSNSFTATWNAVIGATDYYLDVSTSPTFGGPAQLVKWTFPNGSVDDVADGGLPANQSKIISTTATGTTSYVVGVSGSPDRAITNNGWNNGSGTKWWQIDLATTSSSGLTLSSAQRSNNTAPRDFKVQYRIGTGGTWTDVPNSTITVANDWTTGVVNALPLPSACDDQPQLFLRWIMTSNIAVGGNPVGTGSSAIDNVWVNAATTVPYVPGYENLSVGNNTSYEVTGLYSITDYYYRVRFSVGDSCATSGFSNVEAVTTIGAPTYYSQSSGNVSDPIWSETPSGPHHNGSWDGNSNMVVQNGHTVTNTSVIAVSNLQVEAGGSLVLGAGNTGLTVLGNLASFAGTLTANDHSTFALFGSSSAELQSSGGPLNFYDLYVGTPDTTAINSAVTIRGVLQLNSGDFDASAGTVTLISTAAGTGRLGVMDPGTIYTGNLTVQRYIPAGATNWRMLGSCVAGRTIADWNDDFATAGFPGSDFPLFDSPTGSTHLWPSIRWYNEPNPYASLDSSLVGVSGTSQPLVPGQGFYAWSGTSLSTTSSFTVDITGPPNIAQTPITLPMSYTNTGHPNDDGFNMVSNPLPSPIDFTSISRGADVANKFWIFNPASGTTLSWSDGTSQSPLISNGVLQSSQGFWMQTTGPALTTTVDETAKVPQSTGGVFGGSEQPEHPILDLTLTSDKNSFWDVATIVFDQGSPDYDPKDAAKLIFGSPGAPQLSVRSAEGYDLAIDFYGAYSAAITIPVMARAKVAGTYTITASMVGIQSLSCMSLEDLVTGNVTALTDGSAYSFTLDPAADTSTPRFLLHASAPLPLLVTDPICGGNPGQATVTVNNGPLNVNWTDAFGNSLLQQTDVNGNAVFSNIAEGNYEVHVTPGGACGELVADFSIIAPPAVEAAVDNSTPATCPNAPDGMIDLIALGGTAPYSYLWSNGSTDEDLVAAPGSYSVTVTDSLGCTGSTTATITGAAGTIAGFTTGGTEAVVDQPVSFTNTTVLGNTWDWNFGDGTGSTSMAPVHAWASPGIYTVTLTATGGDCTDATSTDIHVAHATGIADNGAQSGNLSVWADPTSIMIDHAFGKQPVQVDVYDATGRLALSRSNITSPGRITIGDQELGAGVWFVRVTSGNLQRTFRVPLIR